MTFLQTTAAVTAALLLLVFFVRQPPEPSIIFRIPADVAANPPQVRAGELADITFEFDILRPECRNSSTEANDTFLRVEGYNPIRVLSVAPPIVRPRAITEQAAARYTFRFRVPELAPAGRAWLWTVSHRECSGGEEQTIISPEFPLIVG